MYSLCQRPQKCWTNCWMCCHLVNRLAGTDDKSGWGIAFSGSPIRKCPGVRAERSSMLSDIAQMGRELRHASICASSVVMPSNVSGESVRTRRRWCFVDLTADSQSPPNVGEPGGIKRHSVPRSAMTRAGLASAICFDTSFLHARSSALAPTKFVPQSLCTSAQRPRLLTNRCNAAMKAALVRSLTSSR